MRARADAAARDLADAREELDRLAPEKERLEREAEALRTKLALLSPFDQPSTDALAPPTNPARANIIPMSIALGALTMLLVVGLALASIILRTAAAPAALDVLAPPSAPVAAPADDTASP